MGSRRGGAGRGQGAPLLPPRRPPDGARRDSGLPSTHTHTHPFPSRPGPRALRPRRSSREPVPPSPAAAGPAAGAGGARPVEASPAAPRLSLNPGSVRGGEDGKGGTDGRREADSGTLSPWGSARGGGEASIPAARSPLSSPPSLPNPILPAPRVPGSVLHTNIMTHIEPHGLLRPLSPAPQPPTSGPGVPALISPPRGVREGGRTVGRMPGAQHARRQAGRPGAGPPPPLPSRCSLCG